VATLTSRALRVYYADLLLRTTLPPAARSTLPAIRYRRSGQLSVRSGGTTLAFFPNRAEVCPVVGSNQRVAFSGQREAA